MAPRAPHRTLISFIEATPAELRAFVEALSGNEYYADLDSALGAHKRQSMFNVIDLATLWRAPRT